MFDCKRINFTNCSVGDNIRGKSAEKIWNLGSGSSKLNFRAIYGDVSIIYNTFTPIISSILYLSYLLLCCNEACQLQLTTSHLTEPIPPSAVNLASAKILKMARFAAFNVRSCMVVAVLATIFVMQSTDAFRQMSTSKKSTRFANLNMAADGKENSMMDILSGTYPKPIGQEMI